MNLRKNLGLFDRIARIVIALVFSVLYYIHVIGGATGVALIIVSVVFVLTSFTGFCPLYFVFGFSSKRNKGK